MIYLRRRGPEPRPAGYGRHSCLTNRQPRNDLAMDIERLPLQIAVGRQGGALDAVYRAVLQPVIEDFGDLAADADRGVGARDQEGPGEAAARQRHTLHRLGAIRPAHATAARYVRVSLCELLDT